MIKALTYKGMVTRMINPTAMKREVPAVALDTAYDWSKQRSCDVFKFGTGGRTSQYSPGQIMNDSDSWTD